MKIKTKLRLGFGFLFVLLLLFGSIALYYMNRISASAGMILKDNYETLSYTREMRVILEESELPLLPERVNRFAEILALEERNVTEKGEAAAVAVVKNAFERLNNPQTTLANRNLALASLRKQLTHIDQLNMDAIVRKNAAAQDAVKKAGLYLITAASFCFLVLFSFILNFPGFVANPLRELAEAIKEIGRKNYKQRLHFEGTDEFAALAVSFNEMVAHLNTEFNERDQAKTNFIATVSHELKTPISAIKMSLKLLDDDRVGLMNTEQKQLLAHIQDDCSRLLKITTELLNLAQVETGNLQLNLLKTDPLTIVAYALKALRLQAEQKQIELELLHPSVLPLVYADVEKTAWVLINFLSNALRYSAAQTKVQVRVEHKGNDVEFSVRDFGKGIDEQYQQRLFDRYFQVPSDGNNKSGSGLGLAIAKDFIEAEQGRIWVESEIGVGSRFCFSLPVSN